MTKFVSCVMPFFGSRKKKVIPTFDTQLSNFFDWKNPDGQGQSQPNSRLTSSKSNNTSEIGNIQMHHDDLLETH